MRKFKSLALLLLLLPLSANALDALPDTNFQGGDYRLERYISMTDCQALCEAEDQCAGFTWVPTGYHIFHPLYNTCWLKHSIGAPSFLQNAISGSKHGDPGFGDSGDRSYHDGNLDGYGNGGYRSGFETGPGM